MFALDFYLIFNELATFLKEGGQTNAEPARQRGNPPNPRAPHKHGSAVTLKIAQISGAEDRSVLQTPQIRSQSVAGLTGGPQTPTLCVLSGQSSSAPRHFDVEADRWMR